MIQLWQFIIVIVFTHQGIIGSSNETKYKVKLLNVVFRHGEKVPQKEFENYPTDPHANHSYFPVDDGDLTNVGKRRMYEIGQTLRQKYGTFLGPYYMHSLIFARSSDVPRTEMSLQLVLAGLFPPTGEQNWNPKIAWQPVSTYLQINSHDILFFPSKCSLNINATSEAQKDESVIEIINSFKSKMAYIANHSGKPIRTLLDVLMLHNLFEEQTAHNLTLPTWTDKVYPKVMKDIATAYMNLRSHTKELRRYNGGFLLREIAENIRAYRDKKLEGSNRKAFIYSAHELNIMALARTLGLYFPIYPRYGSTFIIETLQDNDGKYYVRIILWTGVPDQYLAQRIPDCDEPCPVEKFFKIYEDVLPTTRQVQLCRNEQHLTL